MKTTTDDETWIERFIIELRLRRVPGPVIGDAVASVRELLADSGQRAEEAFGHARDYADSLDLPVASSRVQTLRTFLLPVLGLFAFLVFSLACVAWFDGDPVLVSGPQALLLDVPLLLTLLFAVPSYPRAVLRRRWLAAVLVLIAGSAGALSTLVAPTSVSGAWLVLPALPLLVGTSGVLLALSVIGTVASVRSRDVDEIVEPLQMRGERARHGGPHLLSVATNWLFPVFACVVFALAWVLSLAAA